MPYRVVLTDTAVSDVESVLKWLHDQQVTNAGGRWFAQLMAKLDTLENDPERCSLAVESEDVGHDVRELLLGRRRFTYRILFRISGKTVTILRVWHGSRDTIKREDLDE